MHRLLHTRSIRPEKLFYRAVNYIASVKKEYIILKGKLSTFYAFYTFIYITRISISCSIKSRALLFLVHSRY